MTSTSLPAAGAAPGGTQSKATFFSAVKQTAVEWMQDNAMRLSAALSLYTILSLAPLLVITIKVVSLIWVDKQSARAQVTDQMTSLMGANAADAIKSMLDSSGKAGHGFVAAAVSTALLIFSATGVFAELQDSMNTIWGVKPKPNQGIWGFVRNRLLSVGMVFGIAFLLLVSMFVSSTMSTMVGYVAGDTKWLVLVLDIVVSYGAVAVLFAAIFKFLPDVKVMWKYVWLGALLTAGLFTVGKYGLALYFKYGTPTSAFGAAGSLAAVLLWVYYSAFILFFGAEFTKVWTHLHGQRTKPEEHAVKITEEERAQHGIPSEKRMNAALARRTASPRRQATPAHQHIDQKSAAAYIVVISAIAGALGVSYIAGKRQGEREKMALK